MLLAEVWILLNTPSSQQDLNHRERNGSMDSCPAPALRELQLPGMCTAGLTSGVHHTSVKRGALAPQGPSLPPPARTPHTWPAAPLTPSGSLHLPVSREPGACPPSGWCPLQLQMGAGLLSSAGSPPLRWGCSELPSGGPCSHWPRPPTQHRLVAWGAGRQALPRPGAVWALGSAAGGPVRSLP